MAPSDPLAHLDIVLFAAGATPLACEARRVRAAQELTGADLPAVEALLGLPPTAGSRQTLIVRGADADWPLSVRGPVTLRSLPAADIHPLPELIAARCRLPGLRALAFVDGQLTPIVDPRTWPGA